jgi:gliding motility-associated-like protein
MKLSLRILLAFVLCICGRAVAQNLVPNPSFESHNLCPINSESILPPATGNLYCDDWVSWIGAFAFNTCYNDSLNYQSVSIPNNVFGYRYARTGSAYAGIMILAGLEHPNVDPCVWTWTDDYVQVQLKDSLKGGEWYCVSFYVAPAYFENRIKEGLNGIYTRSIAVDQLGAFFSKTMPGDGPGIWQTYAPNGYLPMEPQVESRKGWILDDTGTNWTPITGVFKAQGGEKWLTIGNFRAEDSLTQKVIYNPNHCNPSDSFSGNGFYYIDDVNVNQISVGSNAGYTTKYEDTSLCNGDTSVALYAPPGADSYKWSTGDTTQSISSQEGTHVYWYRASYLDCGIVTDTIKIHYKQVPLSLGADTSLCEGASLIIHPQNNATYESYAWSTGSNQPQISIIQSGIYKLTTTDACGVQSDSINIVFKPKPEPIKPIDTTICQYFDLSLLNIAGSNLKWYNDAVGGTGFSVAQFSTDQLGLKKCYVSQSIAGCESDRTTIQIDVIAKPNLEIAPDTVFCPGVVPIIGVEDSSAQFLYNWNTGESVSTIHPDHSGVFILSKTNECGEATDSINVLFDACLDCAWIPNSFSPNGDGINDDFGVTVRCPLSKYVLLIYNRWGQKVFQSFSPQNKWKGEANDVGTYFYRLQYQNSNDGKMIYKKGDVTLIK